MKKIISLLLMMLVLVFAGCSNIDDNTVITTPKPTIASSTTGTTVPNTVPTKPTTNAPTIHDHPEPGKNEDDLEYTPSDIPEVYWAVLNNREAIYFPDGCTDCTYGPCYAWLDDFKFPYLHNAIATSEYVEYAVIDMDGDGNMEVLIRDNDTLLLREKDGIVYGYTFGFRGMDRVFSDGTFTWNASAGAYQGTSKLEFTDSHEINEVGLCEEYLVFTENAEFTVEGNKVTEEEYKSYCETLSHTEVTWKRIIRYPLANYTKPDIGG